MDLQALTCPQCGSANVQRSADGTFRCQNCGTRLLLIDKLGRLVIPHAEGWLDCPKCGTVNEAGNFFCTHCGTEIRYKCPNCGTIRLATEPVCGVCGQTYQGARTLAERQTLRRQRRNRSVLAGVLATAIMWSIWMLIVTTLDWKSNHTIDAVATTICCLGPFVGLATGATAYIAQRMLGTDPTAGR